MGVGNKGRALGNVHELTFRCVETVMRYRSEGQGPCLCARDGDMASLPTYNIHTRVGHISQNQWIWRRKRLRAQTGQRKMNPKT